MFGTKATKDTVAKETILTLRDLNSVLFLKF